ncbi:MAG: thioredoxin family protein [Chitinophagales bacterium]|nr:thioredoxin family protein [Bacteroidota bacterium]
MKLSKSITANFLFLLVAITTNAQDVNFFQGDWEALNKEALQQNKIIMVDAFTDWCGPCKAMDKMMFHDNAKVAEYINAHFLAYKVDCERDFGLVFTRKFKISGYPSLLFFNANGQLIERNLGFDPDEDNFLASLADVVNMDQSDTYGYDAKKLDMDWPDFYAQAYRNANDSTWKFPKDADVSGYLAQQEDITTEINWAVMSRFNLDEYYTKEFKRRFGKLHKLYKKEATTKMQKILFAEVVEAANAKDEVMFSDVLAEVDSYFPGDPDNFKVQLQQYYYEATENWEGFAELMTNVIKDGKMEIDIDGINSAAWTLYEKCDNPEILEMAKAWFQPYLPTLNTYAVMDTYAALLYKLNNLDEAKLWANKAIETGKQTGENVQETEMLLKKIQEESN